MAETLTVGKHEWERLNAMKQEYEQSIGKIKTLEKTNKNLKKRNDFLEIQNSKLMQISKYYAEMVAETFGEERGD